VREKALIVGVRLPEILNALALVAKEAFQERIRSTKPVRDGLA
jgi:hypothetical protein